MHEPVLLEEVLAHLVVKPGGRHLDGTLGGGGHARAVLQRAGPAARLLGLDRDPEALPRAGHQLGDLLAQAVLAHGNFADMSVLAQRHGFSAFDGILLDLGVSSPQLDVAERGFSFQQDGPLDMRMDPGQAVTAAELVNTMEEAALADLLWTLGEESASRRVARAIVAARREAPLTRTGALAEVVSRAKGGRQGRLHPATQTFQALRMAVNDELGSLERGLESALGLLAPGGRLAVIAFHSLEDRLVKRTLAAHVAREVALEQGGTRREGKAPEVAWVAKRPVVAGEDEVARNPRARSAKLRVVERNG